VQQIVVFSALFFLGEIEAIFFLAALEQHGPARVLEDGVVERIALRYLGGDFLVEIVVGVLGLPEAAAGEDIADGAVGKEIVLVDADFLLGDERAMVNFRGIAEQTLKGGLEGAFVFYPLVAVRLQGFVVLLDRFLD
jgi:hypothetical protein